MEQHDAAASVCQASDVMFTVYGEDLEIMEGFNYFGHLLLMDNSNIWSVCSNMRKACKI